MTSKVYEKKVNFGKYHPDPISNDRALGFIEEVAPSRRTRTTRTTR